MQIQNKVVIVTGASSGIGLATAKLITEMGGKVALVARSKDKLEDLSHTMLHSLPVVADMTDREQIKNMIEQVKKHFGRIDILVNNAAQGYDAPVEKIIPETFQRIFELDVIGPLVAMQQVIPLMREKGGGVIINISSENSRLYIPNMSAYASSKRALVGISLTAREELKDDKIHVGVVYPYITSTDFERNTLRDQVQDYEGHEPPFRPDSPEFVAEKILEAITSEKAEIFAHEWMQPQN